MRIMPLGDENHRSAFQPYVNKSTTVLTNLQRGNTETNVCSEINLNFHEKAGQGEITEDDIKLQPHVDILDVNDLTALHWACFYGSGCSVKLLIKNGADVNKQSTDMMTPLLLAAAGGHNEVVRVLLNCGAEINQTDILGNTSLILAAAGNHPHTCHELLTFKASIVLTNEDNESAYSIALKKNATLAQAVLENHLVALLTS